jgi:PAS domain S-box-containing protein
LRLQKKFFVLLLPAGVIAASLILLLIHRSVHAVILNELNRSSSILAKAAAQDAAPGFQARSEARLLPVLQSLQKREGALYAAALDARGVVLAHTTITEKGSIQADPITRAALRSDGPIMSALVFRGEPVLEVAVPVWSAPEASPADSFLLSGEPRASPQTRFGILKVGVPLGPAQETERRILRDISLIVAAIGGAALLLVLLLVRGMLQPVNGLMDGIARIGRGRYDVSVPILSKDELGDLARSFNSMSAELARTTVSKEYVEGILESVVDPLIVADPNGAIETVNHAALEALACSAAEIVGRPLGSLFDDDPDAFQREIASVRTDGSIRNRELALRVKSGGRIPAILSASVLKDRRGLPHGYVCIAKDITERKRTEEALLLAKASAEASSKELEAFSYSVAHDLRAPLRAIDGFSQSLLEDNAENLDEQGKRYLARVRAASGRMGQLIDDLLSLSRLTRVELRRSRVDLSALAETVAETLKAGDPARTVRFTAAPGVHAVGDPNLLRIALENLLGNAWKYTTKRPEATIVFGVAEQPDGTSAYFVRDDGAGFDMAHAGKLFGAFQRLHSADEFPGTGIGLATVARIIHRHGGRIWAEGAVDRGATFYFTLGQEKPK